MAKVVRDVLKDSLWSPERRQVLGVLIIAFGAGAIAAGTGFCISARMGGVK